MTSARRLPVVVLAALIGVYVVVFGTLTWRQHANYGTFGFDMGIHDQGIWLTSEGHEPFVTVRGLHYYGHHVNLVSALYAPLYWLGAGPRVLSLTQAIALATGAVPLWLLARRATGSPWIALVPASAWLLHPSVEWITWWHWHPEALAVTPLLFAWWFAATRRWWWFAGAVLFALACKEDVALAVAGMGVALVLRRGEGRAIGPGVLTWSLGVVWFVVCVRVIIPWLIGEPPFYEQTLFAQFGDSMGEIVWSVLTRPGEVAATAFEADRLDYYLEMLGPFGLLAPLGFPVVLVAAPQTFVNVLSSLPGTYDIRFHYSSMVLVGVALGSVEALGRFARWRRRAGVAVAVVVAVAALAAHVAWSPSPVGVRYERGVWAERQARHGAYDEAVASVPDGASVAATYFFVPHLTHRREIYEWPNPWVTANWGLPGDPAPSPATVEYLVVDAGIGQEAALLETLTAPRGEFEIISEESAVVVARRRARP